MLDLLMLTMLAVGFAAAFGYVRACVRVIQPVAAVRHHIATDPER
jgi:hypothetical protein